MTNCWLFLLRPSIIFPCIQDEKAKGGVFLQRQKQIVNCQRISEMKTNTGVSVVFKTKCELKCQLSGILQQTFRSIFDIVKRQMRKGQ